MTIDTNNRKADSFFVYIHRLMNHDMKYYNRKIRCDINTKESRP